MVDLTIHNRYTTIMRNLTINGVELDKSFKFPGGEIQIRLPYIAEPNLIRIDTVLNSSDKILELVLVLDAIKYYHPKSYCELNCHYLPYARQDRRCMVGEAYSSKVMTDLLAKLDIDKINVTDVHSEQNFPACFNEQSVLDVLMKNPEILDAVDVIVAPDKGSVYKVSQVAKEFGKPLVIADKVRNPDNGNLEGINIIQGNGFLTFDTRILIIDDIADGGGTFNLLFDAIEEIIPNHAGINLFITHGIFSKGLTALSRFDNIITTDSICDLEDPKLTIIKL